MGQSATHTFVRAFFSHSPVRSTAQMSNQMKREIWRSRRHERDQIKQPNTNTNFKALARLLRLSSSSSIPPWPSSIGSSILSLKIFFNSSIVSSSFLDSSLTIFSIPSRTFVLDSSVFFILTCMFFNDSNVVFRAVLRLAFSFSVLFIFTYELCNSPVVSASSFPNRRIRLYFSSSLDESVDSYPSSTSSKSFKSMP